MSAVTRLSGPIAEPTAPTTTLFRLVEFVCPRCGDERTGAHVDGALGTYVECDECGSELDSSVLRIPTRAVIATWRDDAVLHGNTALLCADGIHGCSYLALASCRRLAPEMTGFGKTRLLTQLIGSVGSELTPAQRGIAVELGVALGLPATAINATIALA